MGGSRMFVEAKTGRAACQQMAGSHSVRNLRVGKTGTSGKESPVTRKYGCRRWNPPDQVPDGASDNAIRKFYLCGRLRTSTVVDIIVNLTLYAFWQELMRYSAYPLLSERFMTDRPMTFCNLPAGVRKTIRYPPMSSANPKPWWLVNVTG